MWSIISISACLPFSNSYCVLIGPCLVGGVLNSCYVRMVSLSYSKLQDAALIKRPLFLEIPVSPCLPICLLMFYFFFNPGLIIQHTMVILACDLQALRC